METEYIFVYGESKRNRCDLAVKRVIESSERNFSIFLTAGKHPKRGKHFPSLQQDMFDDISYKLLERGYRPVKGTLAFTKGSQIITFILTKKDCWGSLEETIAALQHLKKGGFHPKITLISDDFHFQRINLIWRWLAPKYEIKRIKYATAYSFKTQVIEKIKMIEAMMFIPIYKHLGEEVFDDVSYVKNFLFVW